MSVLTCLLSIAYVGLVFYMNKFMCYFFSQSFTLLAFLICIYLTNSLVLYLSNEVLLSMSEALGSISSNKQKLKNKNVMCVY